MKACILISVQHTIIAQHDTYEVVAGVKIIGIGKAKSRLWRILGTWRLFLRALREKADIYHVHNPELLFWGVLLRLLTRRPVIYDVHEAFPDAIKIKHWINPLLRGILSVVVDVYERLLARFVSCVIVADDQIKARFLNRNVKVVTLFNFPRLEYFSGDRGECARFTVVHSGGISRERGADAMLQAIELVKEKVPRVRLLLIGPIYNPQYEDEFKQKIKVKRLENNVIMIGVLPHEEVIKHIRKSCIGLSLLQPIPKFEKNIPQKVFEYMGCGVPVVTSDLAPIRPFINDASCGILVNPTDPKEIADAIIYLFEHPLEAKKMGENGRRAVVEKYNWEREGKKLLKLYEELLSQ